MTEFEWEELDQKEIGKKIGQPCRDWEFCPKFRGEP